MGKNAVPLNLSAQSWPKLAARVHYQAAALAEHWKVHPRKIPRVASETKQAADIAGKLQPAKAKPRKVIVRVALVDDDPDMLLLLKDILEETGDFICVGSFLNGSQAVSDIPQLSPDLVLMDIQMPRSNGIECTRQLKQMRPDVKVIMVTALPDVTLMEESLQAGADAYLLKPVTVAQCVATAKFTVGIGDGVGMLLTTREREVMRCLAQGLLYKEIADKLRISYSSVHKHQHKIFLKLQVTNRSEAICKWRKNGGL